MLKSSGFYQYYCLPYLDVKPSTVEFCSIFIRLGAIPIYISFLKDLELLPYFRV